MKRIFGILAAIAFGGVFSAHGATPTATLKARIVDDDRRSLMIEIPEVTGRLIDEARVELPRTAADTAVLTLSPDGWKLERDGRAVRISGPPAHLPLKLRVTLFDLGTLDRCKVKLRAFNKDIMDAQLMVTELPHLVHASTVSGFLEFPSVIIPGETLEMKVLDLSKTPSDGQWIIGGAMATVKPPDRIRVELPKDLSVGSPLRVSYFDSWGERVVDSLFVEGIQIASSVAGSTTPRITGCARYGFIGQSVCVCGYFPEATWNSIRIDGQPATVIAASGSVVKVALPGSLTPGPHVISGDPTAGFSATDTTSVLALLLTGSIDSSALQRMQSTTVRLALAGTAQPMKIVVTNLTPGVVSIPGGNFQEIETSGGANNGAERRVDATGLGNFQILYSLDGAPCPCTDNAPTDHLSNASSNVTLLVPRRVLATITIGTPAAMYATAQAIALANGLSVVEVTPLVLTNEGLATFEILDGVTAPVKALALAADPRVTLAQPDIVYDTSQGQASSGPNDLIYGPRLIGADKVQSVARGDGVRVGIVDTGIDSGHPAIHQNLVEYADVTGTGWTPDAHGSLVAGVIAADPDRSPGLQGVAPGARLVGVKSCVAESNQSAAARCWSSTLARGIDIAVQKNVRIVNLSVGGPDDKLLAKMVSAALAKSIAVVSAAGNDGPSGKPSYPAAFQGVIAVTAVDAATHIYSRATQGSYVSLSAPGVDILSSGPGGRTEVFSGTSAATAFVSGAVALLMQQKPNLSLADLRSILQQTAKPLGASAPDSEFGYGLLDVCLAMTKVGARQPSCK